MRPKLRRDRKPSATIAASAGSVRGNLVCTLRRRGRPLTCWLGAVRTKRGKFQPLSSAGVALDVVGDQRSRAGYALVSGEVVHVHDHVPLLRLEDVEPVEPEAENAAAG